MKHHSVSLLLVVVFVAEILAACSSDPTAGSPTTLTAPTVIPTAQTVATEQPTTLPTVVPTAQTVATEQPTALPTVITASQMADEVLQDVGAKDVTVDSSSDKRVVVFEERHDSRAVQVEIAIMLNRLHLQYGLQDLGLEGATMERGAPSADWFHKLPDPIARRDVAVYMLKEGEISAAEFMTMIYPDFRIHPIDIESEYAVELSEKDNQAFSAWLQKYLPILEQTSLTADQQQQLSNLLRPLQDQNNRPEACQWAAIIPGIVSIAQEVGVDVNTSEQGVQGAQAFYQAACKRSETMAENTAALTTASVPIAMIVGAAHTSEVVEFLKQHSLSIAVLSPLSLKRENGDLLPTAYDRKLHQNSVEINGTLGALLDKRRKPRPCIDEELCQLNADIRFAAITIVRAAAGGDAPPFGLDEAKLGLGGGDDRISIDLNDIEVQQDGAARAIIFSVTVLSTGNKIWLGVKQIPPEFPPLPPSQPGSPEWAKTLEEVLKEILKDIKHQPPPDDPGVIALDTRHSPQNPAPVMLAFDVKAIVSNSKEAVVGI